MLFVWIALVTRYYFDAAINVYYIAMSVVGWIKWVPDKDSGAITVEKISSDRLVTWLLISGAVCIGLAYVVDRISNPSLVYLDSFTTVFAMLATWMLVKKIKENWLIWIAVDLVAAGMYFHKELYFIGVLFLIYTAFAVFGYIQWSRMLTQQT